MSHCTRRQHGNASVPRLSKYPVSCPVVCTEPVCRLGELSCVACLEDREKYREASEAYDARHRQGWGRYRKGSTWSAVYLVDGTMRQGRYLDGAAQRWDVLVTAPVPSMGLALPQGAHHKAKPSTSKVKTRKEYRLQQYMKSALPDEELRALYEKMQEQAVLGLTSI
eukprot:Skav201132  [mRNA]  locus=scaffold2860:48564:58747:+ [translate_table: standard]